MCTPKEQALIVCREGAKTQRTAEIFFRPLRWSIEIKTNLSGTLRLRASAAKTPPVSIISAASAKKILFKLSEPCDCALAMKDYNISLQSTAPLKPPANKDEDHKR